MALQDILAELAVNLRLNTSDYSAGVAKASAGTKRFQRDLQAMPRSVSGIGGALKGLAGGFAGVFAAAGVGTLIAAAKSGLDYASSLGEVSQQLGVTSTDLQTFRYAATQVGISQDEMDQGLAKLTRTLGEAAQGGKAQKAAFDLLGVSITDSSGRIKTAGAIMPELAQALSLIPDPARRAAIEVDLFGKTGQKLDTLLSGGAAGINALTAEAQRLGVVLSPQQIANADKAADTFSKIKLILQAKLSGVVAENAGAIERLATGLGNLAVKATDAGSNYFAEVGKRFGELNGKLVEFSAGVKRIDAQLGEPSPPVKVDSIRENWNKFYTSFNTGSKSLQESLAMADRGIASAASSVADAIGRNWLRIETSTARMVTRIRDLLTNGLSGAWGSVKKYANEAGNHFYRFYDRTVGHSYVPDTVDEIGRQMARLDEELVRPVKSATDKAAASFRDLQGRAQVLLNDLFPEQARANQYARDMQLLTDYAKGAKLPVDQLNEALSRLAERFKVGAPGANDNGVVSSETAGIVGAADEAGAATDQLAEDAAAAKRSVIESFGQMAAGTIQSLRTMVDTFKSGDILGAVESIVGIVGNVLGALGKAGIIGGKSKPLYAGVSGDFANYGGARAAGGPVVPGKSYLVGERGPEYVSFGRRGMVHPHGSGMPPVRILVTANDYFDARVDQRASGVAAPMAGQAVVMGAAGAEARSFRRARRSIP